eukprot:3557152-Rhodomonas_salina.1
MRTSSSSLSSSARRAAGEEERSTLSLRLAAREALREVTALAEGDTPNTSSNASMPAHHTPYPRHIRGPGTSVHGLVPSVQCPAFRVQGLGSRV